MSVCCNVVDDEAEIGARQNCLLFRNRAPTLFFFPLSCDLPLLPSLNHHSFEDVLENAGGRVKKADWVIMEKFVEQSLKGDSHIRAKTDSDSDSTAPNPPATFVANLVNTVLNRRSGSGNANSRDANKSIGGGDFGGNKFVEDCYFRIGSEKDFGVEKPADKFDSQLLRNLATKEFKSNGKPGKVMIRPTGLWTKVTNFYSDDFFGRLENNIKKMM